MGNRVPHETHIAREFLACRRLLSQPDQVCGESRRHHPKRLWTPSKTAHRCRAVLSPASAFSTS